MIVYTFRTFPHIDRLRAIFGDVFVFGKLHQDLARFKERIDQTRPDAIMGVAIGEQSRFEPVAVNNFGTRGSVVRNATPILPLSMPAELPHGFIIAPKPSSSFCNWTMYQIRHYLDGHHPETKLFFAHVRASDISTLGHQLAG